MEEKGRGISAVFCNFAKTNQTSYQMNPNSLVSIDDLSKEQILQLLETARFFEEHPNHKILDGKVVATLFFEPSTRTRLSFETAAE